MAEPDEGDSTCLTLGTKTPQAGVTWPTSSRPSRSRNSRTRNAGTAWTLHSRPRPPCGGHERRPRSHTLLIFARDDVTNNLNKGLFEIAPPTGTDPDPWQNDSPEAPSSRVLFGEFHSIDLGEVNGRDRGRVTVQLTAIQLSDGRIDDGSVCEPLHVHLCDYALTIRQAREAAALLIAVADEADRLVAE
jgi:hypothetical protein